ncbi:hypothetical protein [Nocardia sp. NPDC004860]
MPVPAGRTLPPGRPITERQRIAGLLVALGLIAVPALVDLGLGAV